MTPTEPDPQASQPERQSRFLKYTHHFEELVLCLLLSSMILLACLQILLRSVFSSGLVWADPLLRYLVLWSGLLGAVLATSRGEHIAIDLAEHIVPLKLQPLVKVLCNLFCAVTSGFLTWAAFLFIQSEIEYGSPSLFGLPSWYLNVIFPLAFGLICLRYTLLFCSSVAALFRPGKVSNLSKADQPRL
ncbi:TRAP transporter small permease [Desulfosediminicola ganghwensis]|uniref:TRAP transporter small permease n=1 Tax=Desulfosediminicola ganghwensis TaxID=2569540 RepID=UPI0010AB5BF7|nr:TRAP transporter small permease [Desulfosediminicola ganghwensis]